MVILSRDEKTKKQANIYCKKIQNKVEDGFFFETFAELNEIHDKKLALESRTL